MADIHEQVRSGRANRFEWRRIGKLLLIGGLGGLAAGFTTLLLFKGLYALSFALAERIDSMWAFAVFAVGVVISIFLSGLVGGLASGGLSGLIIGLICRPSGLWLVMWVLIWIAVSTVTALVVMQIYSGDPTIGMVNSVWWVLIGLVYGLVYGLVAPIGGRRR
jgi:hypothetical protein